MKTISHATLKRAHACQPQLDKFAELFGTDSPVTLTRELCLAHANVFDWGWAAEHLLTAPQRAAYEAACAPAWAAACATAQSVYDAACAACATAQTAYEATCAARAARAPVWATYKATRAPAFFNASQL